MILVGSCVRATGSQFGEIVAPSLSRVLGDEDVVVTSPGDDRGISAVYNEFVRDARTQNNCEALVLLHDDVEIVDPNFRAKVLAAVREESVGVVGVVGGAELRSIAWWEARRTAGKVFETRGPIDLGPTRADVDVVDGLMLIVSPKAFLQLSFDEETAPRFHGYDVDFCLQARAAGLRVTVRPIEVLHRTKGGFGDSTAFDETARSICRKWPAQIRSKTRIEQARTLYPRTRTSLRRLGSGVKRRLLRLRQTSLVTAPVTPEADTILNQTPLNQTPYPPIGQLCLACGASLSDDTIQVAKTGYDVPSVPERRWVVACVNCGTGLTWPPPSRVIEGEGIWSERYGDTRLSRRTTWFSEALKRAEWVELFVSDGCLLEVGCGTGEFVKTADDLGYIAYGVEPSAWAAEQACELNISVETGFLSDWVMRYPGLRPDVVCLWHVLEHIPEPLTFLGEVISTLRPGGYVFLEVPNFASSAARRLGERWDAAQPDDHFVQYTPEGITTLLAMAGFEVVQSLPMSRRLYESNESWRRERNEALLGRYEWPPLDLLRVVAHSRATSST